MVLKLCLPTQIDAKLGVNEMNHLQLWLRPQRSHPGDRSVRDIPNQWVACNNRIGSMWCTTNSLGKQGMYSTFGSSSVCVVLDSRIGDMMSRYGMSFPTKIAATLQGMCQPQCPKNANMHMNSSMQSKIREVSSYVFISESSIHVVLSSVIKSFT